MRGDFDDRFSYDLNPAEPLAKFANDKLKMKIEKPSIEKESEVR
jgi:hypothetical protein